MVRLRRDRFRWILCLALIIPLGVLSRIVRTGSVLFDKYLGDALYAAMMYALLRLWWPSRPSAAGAVGVMVALELFQLTSVAAHLLNSESPLVRVLARLLGTHFSSGDLLAYGVGIGGIYLADLALGAGRRAEGNR